MDTRTNLYVVGIGPTRSGKEKARKLNKRILEAAGDDLEHSKILGGERLASHAALIAEASEKPRVLFQLDEVDDLLHTTKSTKSPHLYLIPGVLKTLYSSSNTVWVGESYAQLDRRKAIRYPHVCLYGTCTSMGFYEGLSVKNLTDGLAGRLLTFEVDVVDPIADKVESPPPDRITEQVRAMLSWLDPTEGANLGAVTGNQKSIFMAPHSKEALERWENHLYAICSRRKDEDERRSAIWSGAAEKSAKLALLSAASRTIRPQETKIEFEDVDWAIRLTNFLTRQLVASLERVHENQPEKERFTVLNIIRHAGDWVSRGELLRSCRWVRSKSLTEILDTLVEAGEIESKKQKESGRPMVSYRAIEAI
jgi:DNA-binding HxlR family transcriptional regulator